MRPRVACNPASGSVFAIGTTTVNCTATDASGNSSACSFAVTVLLNHAPTVTNWTLGTVQNHSRSVLISTLLTQAADQDNDPLSIPSVSATSTNGGTVTLTSTQVIYDPATNFVGADLFTFTVSDGRGGLATGSAFVQVTSETDPALDRISGLTITTNGVKVRFVGIPGHTYTLQRSSNLQTWTAIGVFAVPAWYQGN